MAVTPNPPSPADAHRGYVVRPASNDYAPTSFATELQTRLQGAVSGSFLVSVDSTSGNSGISIQNAAVNILLKLLTDDDLFNNRYFISNFVYDRNNLRSANDIIRNIESDDVVIGGVGTVLPIRIFKFKLD